MEESVSQRTHTLFCELSVLIGIPTGGLSAVYFLKSSPTFVGILSVSVVHSMGLRVYMLCYSLFVVQSGKTAKTETRQYLFNFLWDI